MIAPGTPASGKRFLQDIARHICHDTAVRYMSSATAQYSVVEVFFRTSGTQARLQVSSTSTADSTAHAMAPGFVIRFQGLQLCLNHRGATCSSAVHESFPAAPEDQTSNLHIKICSVLSALIPLCRSFSLWLGFRLRLA